MKHKMIERLGPEYRHMSMPGDDPRGIIILPREKWYQCERCGMSEGMIYQINADCTPGADT